MPVARFQMPDGRIARFEVPDGATPEQAQAMIQAELPKVSPQDTAKEPVRIGRDAFPDVLKETIQSANPITANIASAGTALSNFGIGMKQLLQGSEIANLVTKGRFARPSDSAGSAADQAALANNRMIEREAPVGAFLGNAGLAALPFGMVGKSIPAAAAVGSALGATQPVGAEDPTGQRALNTAAGGALSAVGQKVANKAGEWLSGKVAKAASENAKNAPIRETVKEAVDAGYVIPPGNVNPSFMNRQLESAGGKIATQQMAASKNQTVTDALARKAAGLADDTPITPETLKAAREAIKQPYKDIAGLGLQPKLDALDAARAEANAAWREYGRQGTRAALNDFKQFSGQAKSIEKEIETSLFKSGKPDLMKQFRDARVALAKNHDVETALIEGGGQVDARAIARLFQRGDKMTGELKTIGSFANNFPKITQPDKTVGTPDAHNLKWLISGALGGGGALSDDPRYAALGLLPLVSGPAARSVMFSRMAQQGLLAPQTVGMFPSVAGGLLRNAPVGATVLGLEALNQ